MKVLVVTSRVTYVMNNYDLIFKEILRECPSDIAGLVIIENFDFSVFKSSLGLVAIGAWRTGVNLLINIIDSFMDRRERRFKRLGLSVLRCKSMNDSRIINWVKRNDIDLIVNLRTRCIYKSEVLNAPKYGCINIHHGILPMYRGTMCDLYALYEGRPAGFTIHHMNEKIDDGAIYLSRDVSTHELNYAKHIARSSVIEGRELSKIIKYINENKQLPKSYLNKSEKPIYSKNPRPTLIKKMIKQGMKL